MEPHEINNTVVMKALVEMVPEFRGLVFECKESLVERQTLYVLAAWFYLRKGDDPAQRILCSKRAVNK